MLWFPVLAVGAAVAFTGKILTRHFKGQLAYSAVHDPDGIRTVARFTTDAPAPLLLALAAELTGRVDCLRSAPGALEVTDDAVRTRATRIDIVRLAPCGHGSYTLGLTRACTGAQLDAQALELLALLHEVLVRAGVGHLTWYARQDRGLAAAHPHPYY